MKHSILTALFFTFICIFAAPVFADDMPEDITGYWLTKKKDVVVKIDKCPDNHDERCGWIHWLKTDIQQYDIYNPDQSKRGRSLCGIVVLYDLEQRGDKWSGGRIYKANDGDTFKARLTRTDKDLIELRGYIGLPALGKTTYLTQADKEDYAACTIAEKIEVEQLRISADKALNN